MKLKISEIFESIQGEGPNAGIPSIFLRTATCNLKCSWCDTKYTWDWENYDYSKEVKEASLDEVRGQIGQYQIKNLVVTGGEPLLQQEPLSELLKEIKPQGYFVEVETNCTIIPNEGLMQLVDQWNVSPKLANSDNPLQSYEISECYNFFAAQKNSYFKFVVENESDLNEIEHFIQKYNLPRTRVLLMPQAAEKNEYLMRNETILSLSKTHNLGYSPRIHIEKWGNNRGK